MTPNDVLRISEPIEKLYMDCSSQLLINLCRHFRDGKALASRDWEIKKLSELGRLTAESIEIIAANTGIAPEEIKNAVSEALRTELSGVENTLASAAKKGLISGPTASFEASENVRIVLQNLVDQAVKDSNVVNTVMLESVRNQYLFAISNTLTEEQAEIERMQSAANLQQLDEQLAATQQALNASTFSVASGSEARTTALRRTIKQLADQGITGYIDAGGHKWSPEAYINMDIRTTVHNAAVQGQKARSADYQVTTFLVSSHSGARPLCYPYQGKVFSWDGSEGTVYDLDGNPYHYESIYNTSYGEPAGLFGINCGHSPITFVDGYTVPRLDPPENEEENNRIYRESQQQRAIEREIRGAKTEALAYQAAGDEEGFQKAAQRVKKYNAEYKDFCKSTGRTERTDRTQVYGYNRSTAQKARWAAKNYTPTPKAPKTPAKPIALSETAKELIEKAKHYPVEANPVKTLTKSLTRQEIVNKIGGGDNTGGSCVSLAMAYAGNKNGVDVLDFRGGTSRKFFALNINNRKIAEIANGTIVKNGNDFTSAHQLLQNVKQGKEYIIAVGQHASVVRRVEDGIEYLELQSPYSNGYKPLDDNVLKWRFGCKRSHTSYGTKYQLDAMLIDIDELKGNNDFEALLPYINTDKDKQLKSASGTIK